MKFVLALIVLVAVGAYGWAVGTGVGDFARDRKERDAAQKRYDIESDPDIQGSMHSWE